MAYSKGAIWADVTNPTSGMTINVPVPQSGDAGTPLNLCINNAGLLLALTIAFPITGVADGQIVKITSQNAITAVTTTVQTGGILQGLLSSLLGGGSGIYQFRASNSTWYKFAG
jgi:hypothetical protein